MKAGFRSNNIDPNARHCMASAVMGFMRTFGADEPMGCYDDIEATDAFVLWGSNMAEMHPILWTRVTDRRLSQPHVKVAVLSTFEHRSFELADIPMVFKPQTDLLILNYIANHIIESGAVNKDFIGKHTRFAQGADDIGYGLRPDNPLETRAKNADKANTWSDISYEQFAASSNPTPWNAPRRKVACQPSGSRPWPNCMPTPSARSCRSGPWASTSTPGACGPTT